MENLKDMVALERISQKHLKQQRQEDDAEGWKK
jgi:hypothetical protein